MTDEINITGKPGARANNPFDLNKGDIRGAKLRAGYVKQGSLSDASSAIDPNAFNPEAVRLARMRQTNAENQRRLESLRQKEQARIAATQYTNSYSLASRMNADRNLQARNASRAADSAYRNDYSLASRENSDREAAYKRTPSYFREQEMGRLGNRGARSVNNGELKELIRIDRHLAKMDITLDKYVKANIKDAPEREAARMKARQTLAGAYSQVSTAAEDAPGLKGFLMRAVVQNRAAKARAAAGGGYGSGGGGSGGGFKNAAMGALGGALEMGGPLLDILGGAAAVGAAAYELPNGIADLYGSTYRSAQPYYNLQRSAGRFGLNAGFSGGNLLNKIYNSHSSQAPSWMKAYGLSPEKAMGLLQNYGINPLNTNQGLGDIKYIAGLGYKPGLAGLGDKTYEDIARTQSVYGMSRSGNTTQLEKVMTGAVTAGVDRAQIFRSMQSILRQNVNAGGAVNSGSDAGSMIRRMMGSGMAAARTGEAEISMNAGLTNTLSNLGSNPISSMPMYRYMMAKGGVPTTNAGVKKLLGASQYSTLEKTPYGRELIKNIRTSPNPAVALRWLGVALQGDKSRAMQIYKRYGALQNGPAGLANLALASQLGISLPDEAGYQSGRIVHGGAVGTLPGAQVNRAIDYASGKTGISKATLAGLYGGESGFNTSAVNGDHIGLGQMSPAALKSVGMQNADMSGPRNQALASALYYKKMYGLFKSVKNRRQRRIDAYDAYYWGPAHAAQIMAGDVPASIQSGTNSKLAYMSDYQSSYGKTQTGNLKLATAGNPAAATVGKMATAAAQKSAESSMRVLESFSGSAITISNAVVNFSSAVVKFSSAVDSMKGAPRVGGGYAAAHLGDTRVQP